MSQQQLFVRTLDGRNIVLNVNVDDDSLARVKELVEDAEGIPAHLQRLEVPPRRASHCSCSSHGELIRRPSCSLAAHGVLPHDTLRLSLRLRGGIDRNNRAGSKPGAGPISSTSEAADRRDRLRRLAMETVDLSKDPYFMMNHLGTFECKLCLTLHNTEGNYLAHTQGKRHQTNLAKRAARDAAHRGENKYSRVGPTSAKVSVRRKVIRIGRPGYKVVKQRDPTTEQRSLLFEISFPEIEEGMQPRHRFMSAFEQRVEAPDKKYQFLLFAADPYETVAFKIPNLQIDKEPGKFVTKWDSVARKFTLQLHFRDSAKATISVNEVARDGAEPRAKRVR